MKDKCEIHKKEKVFTWINISIGKQRLVSVCPVCYNLKKYKVNCKKCGRKYIYYSKEKLEKLPHICQDLKGISLFSSKIPSWRLKVDDATADDILMRPSEDFGMPRMTKEQWKAFYSQEHEVKREKEMREKKMKIIREILG